MSYDNIKEILIGVVHKPGKKGELALTRIRFGGWPIERGIYTRDNVPPGFTWAKFAERAIFHDGHGVIVVYEGDEISGARECLEAQAKADQAQLEKQAKVRDKMVRGRHPKAKAKDPEPEPEPEKTTPAKGAGGGA